MENEMIDWETMTHLTNDCGGTVFESEIHDEGKERFGA